METIIEKIKETNMLENDFIDQCSKYLSSTKMISYSEVKDLIGYKQKRSVNEILNKFDFLAEVDYKIVKEKVKGVCKPVDEIYMTIDTIKCICLMSPTEKSQQFRKYYIQMEKLFKEFATTEYLSKLTNPIYEFNKYDNDVAKFKGKETIYILKIENNIYKFGHTGIITRRLETHKRDFNYECIVKMWSCDDRSVSKNIEDNIKLYIKHQKIGIVYKGHSEIFQTDNLEKVITTVNDYHKTFSESNKKKYQDERLSQKKEILEQKKEILEQMNKLFENIGEDKDLKKAICKSIQTKVFSCSDTNQTASNKNQIESDVDVDVDINVELDTESDNDDCESICSDIKEDNIENIAEITTELLRKCQRCLTPQTEEEFGIFQKTKKPYMNCLECREKQKISDLNRSEEQKQKRREKCKEYDDKNREEINIKKKANYYAKKNNKNEYAAIQENLKKEGIDIEIIDDAIEEIVDDTNDKKLLKLQKNREYYAKNASEIIEQKKIAKLKKNTN